MAVATEGGDVFPYSLSFFCFKYGGTVVQKRVRTSQPYRLESAFPHGM